MFHYAETIVSASAIPDLRLRLNDDEMQICIIGDNAEDSLCIMGL